MNLIKGKPVSEEIFRDSKSKIDRLKNKGIRPKIAIVRIGNKRDDISYEKSIISYTKKLGIPCKIIKLREDIEEEELIKKVRRLNKDKSINGILIFRPLGPGLNEEVIGKEIEISKDIDAMNPRNFIKLISDSEDGYLPSTAKAVLKALDYYKVQLGGSRVAIINRSKVLGKPLAFMLLDRDATVTICHSKTKDLKDITKASDIVITAMGQANYLDKTYFHKDSIVIDVGMSLDKNGKLTGDTNFNQLKDKVKLISPSIGGIGSITTSVLIGELIDYLYKKS